MPVNAFFDASQYEPMQGFGKHAVGNKWPFEIVNTEVKPTKDGDGGLFAVTFTSPGGTIISNYNIFNKSDKAKEIAHGQLSALCRAVGRYQLDFNNDGAVLRGARGLMDVGFQAGQEPTAEKPEGGYVEVKKVYDVNGIEPGKTNAGAGQQQQPAPQTGNQPQGAQTGKAWGNAAPQGQTSQQPSQGQQWGNQNAAPQQNQPPQNQPQQDQGGGAWQPGNAAGGAPPWGNRS